MFDKAQAKRVLSRRQMLRQTSTGFGLLALQAMMSDSGYAMPFK